MVTEAPESEPDVLTTGMEPLSVAVKRRLLIALLVVVVLVAGFATWKLWPRPSPPFSLDDLRDVYAGMVRSDGTNDASVLSKENFAVASASVQPEGCMPLFEETTFSGFPDSALDGVGTYWPVQRMAASLYTFRFADRAGAMEKFQQIDDAVTACSGQRILIAPRPLTQPPSGTSHTYTGTIVRTAQVPLDDVQQQTGYLFTTSSGSKFAIQVFVYDNLVNWQFRYDPQPGEYDPTEGDQLTQSLAERLRFIDEDRG